METRRVARLLARLLDGATAPPGSVGRRGAARVIFASSAAAFVHAAIGGREYEIPVRPLRRPELELLRLPGA